ncbi:hypothetical protein BDV09DRAFT_190776 [Aspergillus tetrazonus]
MLNDTYPGVRQFLRVPWAKAVITVGFGDCFPAACPQYVLSGISQWNMYAPASLLVNSGERLNQDAVAWSSAKDCLSWAVQTMADAHHHSLLPVALFVTGGGRVAGGIYIPSQLPSPWVHENIEAFGGNPENITVRDSTMWS